MKKLLKTVVIYKFIFYFNLFLLEYSCVYIWIPVSQFIPLPFLPWYPCVHSVCLYLYLLCK